MPPDGLLGSLRRAFGARDETESPLLPAPDGRRLALVYRGPAARPAGCSEAVAELLATGPWNLDVRYTGPHETVPLSAASLTHAHLYAQPGGGSLAPAYRRLRRHAGEIRDYVQGGGRYLGFCLGGYLAGDDPGFDLLPGDTDQYIVTPGATVRHDGDTVVETRWRGLPRTVYFQDGPHFLLDEGADATVLATYPNGTVAAVVAPCGAGKVAVVGPHPEATDDWFLDESLPVHHTHDLAVDLVNELLAG
ncbi:BPL-N domain-containing protein [Streptomyces sp. NPDC001793]|uniref:BPL-N domain-containing protein n=1 Tax=Streptomyces sp. NPDC001793 TaxID=3154657 RepID=UPI00331CEECC